MYAVAMAPTSSGLSRKRREAEVEWVGGCVRAALRWPGGDKARGRRSEAGSGGSGREDAGDDGGGGGRAGAGP